MSRGSSGASVDDELHRVVQRPGIAKIRLAISVSKATAKLSTVSSWIHSHRLHSDTGSAHSTFTVWRFMQERWQFAAM